MTIAPELLSDDYLTKLRSDVEAHRTATSGEQEIERFRNLLGHIDALRAAEKAQSTTPVWRRDEPPRHVRCLVTAPGAGGDPRVWVGSVSPDYDETLWLSNGERIHGVTAWMPAPEPFETEPKP